MLFRNHGAITCGKTIHEAMFYTYHLEQACKELIILSVEICKQTVKDLLSFEEDLGKRDWAAWLRLVKM